MSSLYADAELLQFGTTCVFVSGADGVYEILCYGAVGDTPSRATRVIVRVGSPVPVPPVPVPVPPADKWQSAYNAAPDAGQLETLIILYTQGAALAVDPTIATANDFHTRMIEARKLLNITGLIALRNVIKDVIDNEFSHDAPLTDDGRVKLAKTVAMIIDNLKRIKP